MNGNDALESPASKDDIVELGSSAPRIVLHRLAAVRRAKGMPRRVLAQRLGITVQELRQKEESADLSISTLCHLASKLDVSITELVVEPDECLAPTQLAQSQATRLMKVAAKLRDRSRRRSIQRLAQTFVDQLTEILPALGEIAQKNHRHSQHANQQRPTSFLPRPLPEQIFTRRSESRDP
ncbi:MAG: helix-turn-helix domain-containing protein [Thermoguttaceae bacterium]|jgi:transcriptional regulator with XRE-family HTH domain